MENKKILLLVSHCPDPLINKRLELLKKKYNLMLLYNKRGNENFMKIDEIEYVELSLNFQNGKFFKRLFTLLKLRKEVKQAIEKFNPEYIYAFRLDMLLLVVYTGFKKKKIIYEVADLHDMVINNSKNIIKLIIRKLLYLMEKNACKYVNVLSLTSEKFYDVYFKKIVPKEKMIFMPNIPDLKYFANYEKKKNKNFTIGFIGIVRYKEQMKMLIEASEKTNTKVLFAGIANDDEIMNLAKTKKFVNYYGPYNYEKEIAKLYSKCDCIYSVYDTKFNNVKYALPNKLYESIYCELPILVSNGTYLSELVSKIGVGLSVESNSKDDLVDKINKLKTNKKNYDKIIENCKKSKKMIDMSLYNAEFLKKISKV